MAKIARFLDGEQETYGIVRDGKIVTKDEIIAHTGVPLPHGLREFLFDGWYGEVAQKAGSAPAGKSASELELLAPLRDPGKIMCLAFNYTDHASEQGLESPKDPVITIKPRTALCGSGADIELVELVKKLDYEAELAVIVGKRIKNAGIEEARQAIFGYMILNDVSARDIQKSDGQFTRAKSFDTFAPCGPWITTADEVGDAGSLRINTRVNGQMRQDSTTAMMRLKPADIMSRLSRSMTLEPGDIISTGTPAGVTMGSSRSFLGDGDVVEISIERLGTITNTVRDVQG